ncbi:hypothetical protein PIB30_060887 [Stylosanthes scabra]|uniref:Uncharacterized protein n=1 Tax=Stylosanthes scabra TaxID=79078 RepID=A0ABU6TLA0_9FABA|nr:hypothetical protein [Stylosanthes scabra]
MGDTIEMFHPTPPPKPQKKGIHQLLMDKEKKKIEARPREKSEKRVYDTKESRVKTQHFKEKIKKEILSLEKKDKGRRSPKDRKKVEARVKEKSREKAHDVEGSSDNSSKSEGKKKKISSNLEKKKKKRKKEPDEGKDNKDQKKKPNKAEEKKKKKDPGEDEVKQKRTIRCSSFNRLLGKLKVLKRILHREKGEDVHLMTRCKLSPWPRERVRPTDLLLQPTRRMIAPH